AGERERARRAARRVAFAAMAPEFFLFLPQMRMSIDDLVTRAQAAEAAGFVGMAGMDHLAPPLALDQPMYEALTTTAWLAARTERLVHGQLVLCDAFRHPAVLARQAVTIDHASGGRFGLDPKTPGARVRRLSETLDILRACWSGETFDYDGEFFHVEGGRQVPVPLGTIPIVVGGSGPRMLELVAKHAVWWNCMVSDLDRWDELREKVGSARVSTQQMVAFV